MKNQGLIVALGVLAAGCILFGMLRENNPAFIIGVAFAIPAYLLFRKRFKEQIRKTHEERKS